MISGLGLGAVGLAMAAAVAAAALPPSTEARIEARAEAQGEELGRTIEARLRADGPFFTPEERAVIERACGYAPGEWDGFDINMHDRTLICTNGRRADSAEVRAVMTAAEPRIEARVNRIMESAEVRDAISRITSEATAEAMREVNLALANLDKADLDVDVDVDPDPEPHGD
jgi:hypothetical protein